MIGRGSRNSRKSRNVHQLLGKELFKRWMALKDKTIDRNILFVSLLHTAQSIAEHKRWVRTTKNARFLKGYAPFPECSRGCSAYAYFGVAQCENICPNRFGEIK